MYVTSARRLEEKPGQIMGRKFEASLCLRAGTTLPACADFMAKSPGITEGKSYKETNLS
jgi:hypothetical protein